MKRYLSHLVLAATVASAISLNAQQAKVASTGGMSPHETVSAVFGEFGTGCRVTITYGRPFTKNPHTGAHFGEMRKIWGGLVKYGKVWRTGADEATILITQKPLMFGDTEVPAGAYTLWTLPQEDGSAKLIINKQIGQWGVGPNSYNEQSDLARIDLKKETLGTPVDQFTMSIGKDGDGGVINLSWENLEYSAPFTVKQ